MVQALLEVQKGSMNVDFFVMVHSSWSHNHMACHKGTFTANYILLFLIFFFFFYISRIIIDQGNNTIRDYQSQLRYGVVCLVSLFMQIIW